MHKLFSSTSTNTGLAPKYIAAFTGDIKVKLGSITSSSFLIPKLANAKCRAVVPLVTDKVYFDLTNLEKDFSNNFTYLPPEDIQPEFIQSFK